MLPVSALEAEKEREKGEKSAGLINIHVIHEAVLQEGGNHSMTEQLEHP